MNKFDISSPEILFSLLAILIALASAIISYLSIKETGRIVQYQSNFQLLFDLEETFDEEILKLHNIESDFLKKNDISINEFRYTIRSFRAGAAFYILNRQKGSLSKYRKNILNNKKIKMMYESVLKDNFLDQSPRFIRLIDTYYSSEEYRKLERLTT